MAEAASLLRTLLRDPTLRRAAAAFTFFELAEYGAWVAMLVFAYAHGGATTAGLVAFVQLAPAALFAPVAGPLIDRLGASRVLVGGFVGQGLAMGAAAAAALAGADPIAVYALGAVAATAITVTHPAQAVVTPRIAQTPEQLVALNAVSGWIVSFALVAGPALAGALLAIASPGAVFTAGAVCFTLAAALTLPLAALVRPWCTRRYAVFVRTWPRGPARSPGAARPARSSS